MSSLLLHSLPSKNVLISSCDYCNVFILQQCSHFFFYAVIFAKMFLLFNNVFTSWHLYFSKMSLLFQRPSKCLRFTKMSLCFWNLLTFKVWQTKTTHNNRTQTPTGGTLRKWLAHILTSTNYVVIASNIFVTLNLTKTAYLKIWDFSGWL